MTFTEAAEAVLRKVGKPLHYKKITQIAIEQNLLSHVGKTPETTMSTRLATLTKKDRGEAAIVRMKPGVFGLRDWGAAAVEAAGDEEADAEEPGTPEGGETAEAEGAEAEESTTEEIAPSSPEERERAERVAAGSALFPEEEDDDEPVLGEKPAPEAAVAAAGAASGAAGDPRNAAAGGRRRRRRRRGRGGEREGTAGAGEGGAGDAELAADADVGDEDEAGDRGPGAEGEGVAEGEERGAGEQMAAAPSGEGAAPSGEESVATPEQGPRNEWRRDGRRDDRRHDRQNDRGNDRPGDRAGERSEDRRDERRDERRDDMRETVAESGRDAADLLVSLLTRREDRQMVPMRALVDDAIRSGRVSGDSGILAATLSAAARADGARREIRGERPRLRIAGGRVGLVDWALGPDLIRAEADALAALERLREGARRQLVRKLNELPQPGFTELIVLTLERLGISSLKGTRRPGLPQGEIHLAGVARRAGEEIKTGVLIKRGGEIGRERVIELRGSLHHYGPASAAWMITTGNVLSGAREEAAQPGTAPVTLFDGNALARLMDENSVGVRHASVNVPYLDFDLFEALRV